MSQSCLPMHRSSYLDFINVIATIAVVTLHTNYNKCYGDIRPDSISWGISCLVQCLCSFAVPCFFMITGATLLDYPDKYDTKEFFLKRFYKCVIPFLFWSIIALLFSVFCIKKVQIGDITVLGIINSVINAKYNENYWFLVTLFGVYLSIPILAYIPRKSKKSIFAMLAMIAFLLNAVIPDLIKVLQIPIIWNIKVVALTPYLLYVIIGYVINCHTFSNRTNTVINIITPVIMVLIMGYTVRATAASGSMQNTFRDNGSATLILFTAGFFTIMKNNVGKFLKINFINKFINFLRDYSFGIYLTHWFVRLTFVKFFVINDHSIYYCIFGAWVIIAFCVILIWMIRKIPIGKYILP